MYRYEDYREGLFTDEGQRKLIQTREKVLAILDKSGVIVMEKAVACVPGGGDSWEKMAYIDRMVELGDLRVLDQAGGVTQNRLFERGHGV